MSHESLVLSHYHLLVMTGHSCDLSLLPVSSCSASLLGSPSQQVGHDACLISSCLLVDCSTLDSTHLGKRKEEANRKQTSSPRNLRISTTMKRKGKGRIHSMVKLLIVKNAYLAQQIVLVLDDLEGLCLFVHQFSCWGSIPNGQQHEMTNVHRLMLVLFHLKCMVLILHVPRTNHLSLSPAKWGGIVVMFDQWLFCDWCCACVRWPYIII